MNRIVVFSICIAAVAHAQPPTSKRPQIKLPPRAPFVPKRKPIVVAPKVQPKASPRLPKVTGTHARAFEHTGEGGVRFKITLDATRNVDARVFDYLQKSLRVVRLTANDRADLAAWQKHAGPEKPGADIAVKIEPSAGKADDYALLPPDGVDVVRPGVLRVRDELVAGLEKQRGFRFAVQPKRPPPPPPAPGGKPLQGVLKCRSFDTSNTQTAKPLPFVKVRIGEREAATDFPNGNFTIPGEYRAGNVTIEIVYGSDVTSNGVTTPMKVMHEFHGARDEAVTRTARLVGGQLSVGDIELSSVDCELWRLGSEVLLDYHDTVKRSPPKRELRFKRWAGVWGGIPYTYFDHLVLGTDWGKAAGPYRNIDSRKQTVFHEFGHSVRHVADGSEAHWGWDNFRWAYARVHGGCETYNTQYAFNEGWAGYWAAERAGETPRRCGYDRATAESLVDWTESLIAGRLVVLANALSSDSKVRASKMVEVLEKNPGAIHSLRDFEVRYCALHSAGNRECIDAKTPRRPAPPSCPPNYHDDGATCRLKNILAKESYGRGAGTVPSDCGPGKVMDAGLCYKTGIREGDLAGCQAGYSAVGPICWQNCPAGFRDDGAYCAKPEAYGRGGGYPWKFGDAPFDLSGARRRCEAAHGSCEQDGLLFYPKCKSGFHSFGCCVCTPNCPAGMNDIGVSCQKQSYNRGVGTIPTGCRGGKDFDAGLCYTQCRTGFVGVGPVCWQKDCPKDYADHGATCYREPSILVKY